jgi:hypothetical protein
MPSLVEFCAPGIERSREINLIVLLESQVHLVYGIILIVEKELKLCAWMNLLGNSLLSKTEYNLQSPSEYGFYSFCPTEGRGFSGGVEYRLSSKPKHSSLDPRIK